MNTQEFVEYLRNAKVVMASANFPIGDITITNGKSLLFNAYTPLHHAYSEAANIAISNDDGETPEPDDALLLKAFQTNDITFAEWSEVLNVQLGETFYDELGEWLMELALPDNMVLPSDIPTDAAYIVTHYPTVTLTD